MKAERGKVTVHVPLKFISRRGRKRIISQKTNVPEDKVSSTSNDTAAALALAFRWRFKLESGEYSSIADLASGEKQKIPRVYALLRLTLLAPAVLDELLGGNVSLTIREMMLLLSMSWDDQRRSIGRA